MQVRQLPTKVCAQLVELLLAYSLAMIHATDDRLLELLKDGIYEVGFLALGIDGGGVCSAEELMNAVTNQKNDAGRAHPKAVASEGTQQEEPVTDLAETRAKLDTAIKKATKDMSRADKIRFLNEVVTPTLQGERNWKICENQKLLLNLLAALEEAV